MNGWVALWAVVTVCVLAAGTILGLATDPTDKPFRTWWARVALASPLWPLMAAAAAVVVVVKLAKVARGG